MKSSSNKLYLYLSILFLTFSSALAQEICTNGTDDDGDGFIDCYDGDCAGGPSCSDFFYGNPIVCRDEPTENPTFALRLQWGSEDRSADSHATPAVGDLDNDGLPEVVVINRLDQRLFILNGEDGTTAFTYDLGYQPENGIALANLDGGNCGNIYVSRDNSSTITALDCEANLLWETNASDRVGIMGIADFDGDGNAELYYKTEIMDAATGAIVVPGTGDNWVQNYAHSAIAVDILDDAFCADCSGLELITGNEIWAINIASGTRTLAKDLNDLFAAEVPVNNRRYYTKYFNTTQNRTMISVADYNLDGHADVLMPGAYGSSNSSQTTIFLWDVFNDTYLVYDGGVNHNKGTGRLNVADIDGDGFMNTTYVSDQILYALDENLNLLWTKGIDEGSSGFTGTTVFDFDGDGAAETIYRSESYLYVINGIDGSTRTTVPCVSRTQEEYPLVADVDNDGSSELCVPCYTNNNTPFGPYSNTRFSQIRIYEADAGEIWQPSRRVWNQHGYYVVNVNDDLTIPAQQQDHTAIFGTENCETGAPEDVRALNGFLNQTTFLEADGCPSYVSPDITFAGNISATPSACPETSFTVTFDIENTGDTDIYGNLPVTFYDGDPETPGATRLNTEFVSFASGLPEGASETVTLSVEGSGGDFDLYVSLNNSGQNPPITLSGSGFPECDFSNNIGNISVTYTPFTLTVNKLEDNRRCDLSKPDNGEAEAYFEGTLGGSYETFWVEDFAGLSNGDRSDAGATAWTSTQGSQTPVYWGVNTKSGNKVYQTRNTGTKNEVGEVTWLSEVIDISGHTDVDLSLEMLTNNTHEQSGQWRDFMRAFYILDGGAEVEFDVNGELYGSFLYAIAEQQDLNGSTVQIKVTFHSTANNERHFLDNIRVSGVSVPVVQQFTDADGFEFYWYDAGDFSSTVASGSLYSGMPTGSYDVVGFFPGGNCFSDTVNIVINDSVPTFNVHVYESAPYTDCADPDGALSAFAFTQTDGSGDPLDTLTSGYSFSWVLSTEGITPVGTGPTLTNISSESYTVRVEQLITGCTSSASDAPSSSLIIPADPSFSKTDITTCSGPGSTGDASANVGGSTAGYTFEWFYENVDASPEYTGANVSGLLEGTYFLRAIDDGSSCESDVVTLTIDDLSGEPSPVASSVDNTSCTTFTGQVSSDGDGLGTTAGYNFTWYAGKNDDPNNILPAAIPGATASPDGSTISNLPGGYYTVVVEQGGCVGSDTVLVDENFVIPQFTFNTPIDTEESLVLSNNGYVEIPQLFGPGNLITDAVTISYWANISVDNYNNDERIFSSGSTGENQVLLWSDNHNGLAFVVRTSSGGRGRINSGYSATGWAQVVGTWDGTTGDMRMYVNGVLIGTDTHIGSGILVDTGNPMYLGRDGNIGSKKFEGELDEVRIYNKALTVAEINDQLCRELTGAEDGLVAYYDFNNIPSPNTGTTIPDIAPLDGSTNGTIRNGGAANVSYPTAQITCPNSGFQNNRSCDVASPNGAVDLSDKITPAPGGGVTYDYEIYSGFSTAGAPLDANTTGIFTGLPGGFYTVIATDQATSCVTLDGRVSLNDIPDNPAIATSVTDDIGCGTVGLGEIAVTSSSNSVEPTGYTYEIFDGFNFTTEIGSDIAVADGSVGHTYTGLTDGQYRIRVTNDDLTCTSFVDVNVGDNPTNPSWNHPSTIINDNTTCAGTPNGFVSVAVAGGNTNFTFEWYNGSIVDPGQLIAGENVEFIDELNGGLQYTVVATSTVTGCSTPAKTVTVNNTPILPTIVTVEVQPQNSCDVGDGILRAYVDEPDPSDCVECTEVDDYSFAWFLGTDTSTPLIEATDPGNNSNPTYVDSSRVEGLSGAYDYTVLVTNNLTGCTNEATINLTYDPLPPTIDAANSKVTANTLCGPIGNGSVVAAVNFVGETINGAVNDQTWDIITDCNTITDLNSSILPDGSIELTPDVNNQAGKAYLGDSVDFSTPTRIDYWMYLGDKDGAGADGITFIFHQDPAGRDALGRYGCNLGIGDESCFGGTETAISPSVAVEFDTWDNGGATKDPAWDHMAFVLNGDMSEPLGDVGTFYNANQPRIVNGQDDVEAPDTELRVTITIVPNFDGTQTFSVYVEDELRLQRTQDFINDLFGGNPMTIGGFTASTGGARNQQYVRLDPYFGEYDFDWYTGTGVNPADEIVGADRPFLCDLLGGDYTLVVTYGGTGCTSSPPVTFTIPNDTDTATVSFSGTSNTVCDPALAIGGTYTGSLTANITQNPADYVFAWFEGSAPTADTLATTQSINNIPGGDYTVVVESLAGGCITTRDTTLVDVTVDPAIVDVNADVTVNNVTSCEGAATYPNGSITVNTVGIGTGPFGFWYYYGADTTTGTFLTDASDIFTQTSTPGTASVNVNGNGTSILTGLSAGDYTIIVLDSASGCTSVEANINIIDVPTIPNLDQTVTPNTVCDPAFAASGAYDGEVEIITTDGSDAATDYTYAWFEGTGTSTPVTLWTINQNILSEAPDGNYTVVATSNSTACDTTIYATIGDATVDPTITSTSVTNVTACEGGAAYPNGSITVSGFTGTGPFGFMYWAGADTTTGVFLADGVDIFTQTSTAGTASVNVSGNGTTTLTGLSAGDYTIIVIDSASGCTSIEANETIINIPTIPALGQNITDNTVCDNTINNSGEFDGEVEIVTTDASNIADYSFIWYDGTGTGTPTSYTATNNILSEAPDGNYTVVATSNLTGCDTTIYATIGDATVDPVLGTINVTDMSVCDGAAVYPNGGFDVDETAVTNGSGDYSYEFYWGSSVNPARLLANGDNIVEEKTGTASGANIGIVDNIVTNLDTGFYTVVLIDNVSGCVASEASIEVESVLINININTSAAITHWTDCATPDGAISVVASMASGPAPALGFSYEWYFGSGTTNLLDAGDFSNGGNPSGENTSSVSGLEDGTYTVLVTNNDTECTETAEFDVEDQRVYPVINPAGIVVTDNVNCSGPGTGEIDPTGAVTPATGIYLFTLYDPADVVLATEDMTGADDGIFTGLSAGNYKVGVELASTGCTSVTTVAVVVEDDLTSPNVTHTILSQETSCVAPNGQIEISSPGGVTPTGGWDINLFQGSGTGGVLQENIASGVTAGFPLASTANLNDGLYTIQIINNQTGCDSLKEITILEIPDTPSINTAVRTNDNFCVGDNGTITITSISNGGAAPEYNIYTGSSAIGVPDSTSTDNLFENLPAGTFTVTVVKTESGCESPGATRTVNSVPISFTPGSAVFSDQSSCLISDPNGELIGSITVQGTGPSTNVVDYDFEWYQGQNTNPANRITTGGIISTAVVSGTSDSRVAGLPTGTYRLKVIEPVSGCFYTIDRTINLVNNPPVIPGGGIIITDADQCAPSNGEIDVTVNDGGSAQPYDGAGGYTFEIFEGPISPMETPVESFNQTVVTGAPNYSANYTFQNLQPGDYTIRVTDNNTSCLVTSTLQTVNYVGATMAFDVNNMANTPLTGCFLVDGTIDIGTSLTFVGNSDDATITWYVGTDTSNTADLISNRIPAAVFSDLNNYMASGYDIINGVVTNLPAVSYSGVVELSNGCKFLIEMDLSIVDAPDLLTSVSTPVTRCVATYDGAVDIQVTPNNGNNASVYSYYLYPGNLVVTDVTPGAPWDPPASSYNGGVTSGNDGDGNGTGTFSNNGPDTPDNVTIGELDAGTYTVVIEINTGSGCVTNVETIVVDPPTETEVTLNTKSDNTICDVSGALDYNGSITVDAEHPDFVGSTFTFEWYYDIDGDGNFSVGQTAIANGANGAGAGSFVTGATLVNSLSATLDGIGPGWYRVIATHTDDNNANVDETLCPDTLDIQIFDDFVDFEVIDADNIATQTNVLDCSGGPDEFGEFELEDVWEDGVQQLATTIAGFFTITWEYDNGGGFAPYAPNIDQNHSDDLAAGDYRLNIVSNTTGCDISYEFTIDDVTEDPVVNLLGLTDNTICVGGPVGLEADGQIAIEIQDELGAVQDPVNYNVTWYLGSIGIGNDIPANQVAGADFTTTAVDITVDDLPGGTYWVEVVKNNGDDENCTAIASFVVDDDPAVVSIQKTLGTDFTRQQQTDCTPVNGALTLLNVYEDGAANAVAGGDYLFNWYDNDMVTPITVGTLGGAFNEALTDLPFGTYYVEAENQLTDCVSPLVPFTINDSRAIPNVQVAQVLPDTTCVGSTIPSGHVEASAILPGGGTGDPNDFTFTWYEGASVNPAFQLSAPAGGSITIAGYTIGGTNNEELIDVPQGQYTVQVEDNVTPGDGCTATATVTVSRFTPIISIATSDITIVNDTDCSGDNGSATVNAITVTRFGGGSYKVLPADFGDWDFEWFDAPTAGASLSATNNLSNEGAGIYYVEVENNLTGCIIPTRKAVTIQENISLPLVQLVTKTPDEYCATVTPNEGDGSLTIKIVHEGNNPANAAQYGIEWFRGTGTGTTLTSAVGSAVSADSLTLTGLSAGTYTVGVVDELSPNLGCIATQTFTINRDAPTYALPLSALTLQDNLNCTSPNGSITINGVNIDGVFEDFATTADNYTINWPSLPGGAVLTPGGIEMNNDQVTNLPGGTYQVDISNDRTGCTISANISIDDDTSNPLIQLVAKSADTYCATVTPFEGDGWLNIKLVHEGNNPADSTLYNFEWFRGTGTGTTLASTLGSAVVSPNGTGITGLSAGTFTVRVTDANTPNLGCFTTQTFTINRDAPIVSLPLSALTTQDNLNCSNPNGSITIDGVNIDGVFEDFGTTADTYTINWTGLPGGATLNTIDQTNDQVMDIEGGTYTVDVTNDRTGCTTTANITIDDDTSNPLVQLVIKQADEYCDNTGFVGNGSLEMRIVHEGNNPADPLDYNIQWFRGTGTGTTLASTAGSSVIAGNGTILSGLSTDTYTVLVTKNAAPNDQCLTTTTFSIVKDEPAFSIQTTSIQKTDNTNCTNPNGTIEITNVVVDGVAQSMVAFGADYAFTWPDGVGGGLLSSTNGSSDNRADNLPAGTYRIIASNVATGCSTDTISVSILDDPTEPVLSFAVDQINSNCGPTKNGQLTVTATTADGNPNTNVGRYAFTWYDGVGTTNPTSYIQNDGIGVNDNQSTLLALDSGYYTVTVFDNVNECSTTGTYAVSETLITPQILLSDIVARPDTTCDAGSSGTIIVADSSFASGVLDDYDVQIRQGSPTTGAILAVSAAGSGNTDLSISSLDPGPYYVLATLASTECVAAPVRVNIQDERFPPVLLLDTLIANVNCGGSAAGGQLRVLADGFDHTNPDYTFQWHIGQTVGVVVPFANGGNTSNPFNLAEGFYTLEVLNSNTGCLITQVFELPSIQRLPTFSSYEVNNNTACVDNGSIVLLEGLYGTATIDSLALASDYTIGWYSDPGLTTVVADPVPATPLELDGLGAGTYYVTLTNDTTDCTSTPLELVISDNILFPSINGLQLAADSTCIMAGTTPTGALRAIADNQNNPGSNYTFTWYAASDLITPISNNDTLSGQYAGDYVVEVTNASIGCTSTETFTIQSRPVNIVINDVVTTAPTTCMPPNGTIEVTDISYGVLSDYTFEFRDPSNTTVQNGPDSIYVGAAPGRYSIYATHTRLGCTNPLVYQVVVDDGNIVYPDIDLASFVNQRSCDPSNPNGSISVTADGSTDNVQYTFEWRDDTNTIVEPNNATVSGIAAGEYTVNVTDNVSGCTETAVFQIDDLSPSPIRLVISTSPNTNCVDPNGEVSATIRNLPSLGKPISDYEFYWFNGDQTTGTPDIANPDYTGTLVTDLIDGDYTVYVVDMTDVFCTSLPTLVTIQDMTLPPPFEIEVQNHVTICYDSLPDGRARISPTSLEANRDFFEFRYEWYVGTAADTTGQTPFVTGIRADSLDVNTYSVLSTDLRTGCKNLVTFDIIDDADAVPAPDVNVIADRDNCLFPNGLGRASISGTITDYRFEWFLASGDTSTVQFTGHEIGTLDAIDYTVQATRLSTGCVSPRTPVNVEDISNIPNIEIRTTTSMCLRTEDGSLNQFTGSAEIIFEQFEVIKEIDWIAPDGTVYSNDIKLVNAEPGCWSVRVLTDKDCEATAFFTIETELKIYNGVSANADGRNDYFFIDCVDNFPNNKVQIFNRDGTRVWEDVSYDNNSVRFEGLSNIGRTGLQLPAGTYFYIIEKGPQLGVDDCPGVVSDNTIRPRLQGYLELVR